jgi:hypothetical protein
MSPGRTRLPGLARVAGWLTFPVYVVGVCAAYFLEHAAGPTDGADPIGDIESLLFNAGFSAFAVVGTLLLIKRPANPVGWIMAAIALLLTIGPAGGAYATYVMATRGQPDAPAVLGAWIMNWFWFLFLALALVYLPMLFPDGRLVSRRWLPVAVLAGVAPVTVSVLGALRESLVVGEDPGYRIDNPIGIEGLGGVEGLPIFGVLTVLFFVGFAGAISSVVVRFRRSRGIERQQMKWFVSAVVVLVGSSALASGISDAAGVRWLEDAGFWLSIAGIVSLPVAVGVAILRYRLYDIDLVINRTLVYGALTAMLVAAYVGGVVVLQYLFRVLTGGESQLAIVASTLAIAALFNPMRRRVQGFVDRRFYREKYDAAKTLSAFSAGLKDATDLDRLRDDLVGVVRETVQPEYVSFWLRPPAEADRRAGAPE